MEEKPPAGGPGEDNRLPLEPGDRTVLSAESAAAIETLRGEIARLAAEGPGGLVQIRTLLDVVGEAVFSSGEAVIAGGQEEHEEVAEALLLFASRNLEFASRAQLEPELFSSGIRYLLREAEEGIVVAHAMAAASLLTTGSSESLRDQGRRAFEECRRIAGERGFGPRVDGLVGGG